MPPRIPKQLLHGRSIDTALDTAGLRQLRAMAKGFSGMGDAPSVMRPEELRAYEDASTASLMADAVDAATGLAPMAKAKALLSGLGGLGGVIKAKGGNWVGGSLEDALRGLKRGPELDIADLQNQVINARANTPQLLPFLEGRLRDQPNIQALNKWIQGPLTKYIKRDMGTEGDPIRKLADQGILHTDLIPNNDIADAGEFVRNLAGPVARQVAETPMGRLWEDYSDMYLEPTFVGGSRGLPDYLSESSPNDADWLRKLAQSDVETPVFGANYMNDMRIDLGFGDLVKRLEESMAPIEGLPRNLQLRPEQLQQMGMEKAVRHAADIKDWQTQQEELAKIARLRGMGAQGNVIKEYPDAGLRWHDLQKPEKFDPESMKVKFDEERGKYVAVDDDGNPIKGEVSEDATYADTPEEAYLGGMLHQEGNIMGHCVGSYCPDVASGQTKIYSLRDETGEPHVTIEVRFPQSGDIASIYNNLDDDVRDKLVARYEAEFGDTKSYSKLLPWFKNQPEFLEAKPGKPEIIQIKGKGNEAPAKKYIPAVQDFLRSGDWAPDIGDFENSGLVRRGSVFTPTEKEGLIGLGAEVPEYLTLDEIANLRKLRGDFVEPPMQNPPVQVGPPDLDFGDFAEGGLVASDDFMKELIAAYNQGA